MNFVFILITVAFTFISYLFLQYTASAYPVNPNITTGFREITISYAPLTTPINITGYDFEVNLANRPNYFVPFSSYSMNVYPNHTIKNLLIGETIAYRVVARVNGKEPWNGLTSGWRNVSTKSSSLAQVSGDENFYIFFSLFDDLDDHSKCHQQRIIILL